MLKTFTPLDGLRRSRDSGSAHWNMPQTVVLGRPGGVILAEFFVTDYSFVLNAVIAILLPAICARHTSEAKMPKLVFLRKTSIVIYFTHFVPVTVFHILYIKHLMPYEYGMLEFLVVFSLAFAIACAVVRLSDKFKFLKYLY